ncbi:MAG: hypothetical protein PHS93_09960 [Candidatus Omnitrophica bacterium]|nr:hypothetical protein [Candidatus Omnitrophota bacterium]MDD5353474.1 hypothetical protein [Candidatus Omnitrophota bacterium]MDD5591698.1 hypothetical protein [Candidatus Omnitrophota bacterium]
MSNLKEKKLLRIMENSRLLSTYNRDVTLDVFYDAIKMFYYKQKHRNKLQLKHKEIAQCLNLIYYHHQKDNLIIAQGNLLENFGRKIEEKEALDYYDKKVMGKVKDSLGEEITIDELGMDFLYDGHEMKPDNFLEPRAKRLPWIHYTLENSREIYEKQERNSVKYLYVSHFEYPVHITEAYYRTFFLVIIIKRKDGSLGFLTAFSVDRYNQFLSKLESWRIPCFRKAVT